MGKDDNELFDEQIDEDEDLLNFDLDDLTPEDSDEDLAYDEEIIELTDRIEMEEEPPSDNEEAEVTAEIIRIQRGSEQIDEIAETLTDLDISVLAEEEEPVMANSELFSEDSDEPDISEEDFNKIFEDDGSTAETVGIDESENSINELISEINFDGKDAEPPNIEGDIITEEDFDDGDLAKILEDDDTGEMELERLEGTDDSLLEVIEKAGEDELAETITNLLMDDKAAVLNLDDEGDFAESKESPEPETPAGIIPEISELKVEEIITQVLQSSVEKVIKETVAEETEKAVRSSVVDMSEKVIRAAVVEVVERVVRETVAEAAEKVFRKTVIEVVERVVQETVAEVVERVVKETVAETVERVIREIAAETAEKVIRETVIEVVEKVVQETVAEVADRVLSESIEALKQSLEINSD